MAKAITLALLCACMVASVYSRDLLQGSSKCPDGCASKKCIQDKTSGKYVCTECINNLMVSKAGANAGKCACRAGMFWDTNPPQSGLSLDLYGNKIRCNLCEKGNYCLGGVETAAGQSLCSTIDGDLTTVTKGSTTKWQCVEKPGYGYSAAGGNPAATACEVNTYNPGLLKKVCTACPAGFVSDPADVTANQLTSIASCKVPPGYFLRSPGEVAPCPQGAYKTGYATVTKCVSCTEGVTTPPNQLNTLESDCKVVKAGYYAVTIAGSGATTYVTKALPCPQKHWCGGITIAADTAAITKLPDDAASVAAAAEVGLHLCKITGAGTDAAPLWTKGEGATTEAECLVPPGHKVAAASAGAVVACGVKEYRAGWSKPANAATCNLCATAPVGDEDGINSVETEPVVQYTYSAFDQVGLESQALVRGATASCKLTAGYGMYKVGSTGDTYRIVSCKNDNYGAATDTYGLGVVPCRSCPVNMETVNGTVATSPEACKTKPGYGYDGVRSDKCPIGSYSLGGARDECTRCDWGYTTSAEESKTPDACVLAKGFQYPSGGVVEQCPVGTYADTLGASATANRECGGCPSGYITADVGSEDASDCNVCAAGYGTIGGGSTCDDCANMIGYGAPDRQEPYNCTACPTQTQGFRFIYDGAELDPVIIPPVIKSAQSSQSQCLAKYAQIGSSLWYLAGADEATAAKKADGTTVITTLADCMARCDELDTTCMFYTFAYTSTTTGNCYLGLKTADTATDTIGFKAVPSGDVAGAASAKAISSGMYTMWDVADAVADVIGEAQTPAAGVTTKAGCMQACDADAECAGFRLDGLTGTADDSAFADGKCLLIHGESDPALLSAGVAADRRINYRSMTRVVLAQLE